MASVENVVLVTLDGVRSQEMFNGLDKHVFEHALTTKNPDITIDRSGVYKNYWADSPEERRQRLLPFIWGDLLKNFGCILGNRERGSFGRLTNKYCISYPGYAEILTGYAHENIKTNEEQQISYLTICEFIKHKFQLQKNQVAVFASWKAFSRIVEHQIGTVVCNAGLCPYNHPDPFIQQLNQLQYHTVTPFPELRHDVYTFQFALAHLKTYKPKFLYIGFGETDDWAHEKRYDLVLDALHRCDEYIRRIWEHIQIDEHYKNKTAMIITTDHGRGDRLSDWTEHDSNVEGSQYIWIACAGPHLTKRGDLNPCSRDTHTISNQNHTSTDYDVHTNQIAATILKLLGLDPREYSPNIGEPIAHFV